ncbi:SUMF1/EgtB/PvdO family nonheme iron enzyme [Simkania negevensis]|uniref:non-specific serine/threonine protein kinase n=1 Tax=Simkania negevensis TaxID=83561 RepID=A0ABS3AS66_9BACT|nr:SUMF1/EgtB/PvdO family nonheme iron enzyme [Simkania negevensis]
MVVAPRIGSVRIIKELGRDVYGTLYWAYEGREKVLLRVIAPEISNAENFLVRFELLKSLLPAISHQNIVEFVSLGTADNLYYFTKRLSEADVRTTLQEFKPDSYANSGWLKASILEQVASGLEYLEDLQDSYHRTGLVHGHLHPEQIHLFFEKEERPSRNIVAKIDGFGEPFLFYGEEEYALLVHTMAYSQHESSSPLFAREPFRSWKVRNNMTLTHKDVQYSFGAVASFLHTGAPPCRGFTDDGSFSQTDHSDQWKKIITTSCHAPYGRGYSSFGDVAAAATELRIGYEESHPDLLKAKKYQLPPGMALVALDSKAILGANDGSVVEKPAFKGIISPFFIDIAPVTCQEFTAFMPSYAPSTYSKKPDCSATLVSKKMAKDYCEWRSKEEGLAPGSYRLPTEYEWEAAVRGATGEQYPWGEEMDKERLYCGYGKEYGTCSVKQFPPGRFGLYDMLGNVWEWTSSFFSPHPLAKDLVKGYSSKLYVVKGGCWHTPLQQCRASLRAAFPEYERRGDIGFRCVRSVDVG